MILLNLSFQDKLKSHPVQKPLRQLPAFGHPELRDVASSQKGLSFSLALNSKIIPPPPTPQADHPILSCTANCWPDLSPPPATWYEIPLPPFFLPFSVFFCCTATTGQQESSDPIQMTDDRQTKGVYRSSLGFGKSVHSFFYPHQLLDNLLRSWQSFYCLMDSVMDVSFSSPVQSLLLRCSSGTYFFYLTMLAHLSVAIDRNSCI